MTGNTANDRIVETIVGANVGAKNFSPLPPLQANPPLPPISSTPPSPKHNRRSVRLQGYDYSKAGAYFVTICTRNRECLFGEILDGVMLSNDAGGVVQQCWDDIPAHFPHVELDAFVIMPNHVHGILSIVDSQTVGAKNFSPLQAQPSISPPPSQQRPCGTSKTIGSIVRGFKIGVTKWMRQHTLTPDVWQRNYWEHVVRNDMELNRIREYICNNPIQWEMDQLNPGCAVDYKDERRGEKIFASVAEDIFSPITLTLSNSGGRS